MERSEPNAYGVLVGATEFQVPLLKVTKTKIEISVACGPDGKFYSGYSYHFGFTSSQPGGASGPSMKDKNHFDSVPAAIMHQVSSFRKQVQAYIDSKTGVSIAHAKSVLVCLNNFAKPYETELETAARATDPEPVKTRPAKPMFVLGWKYGGDGYQLYLQRREKDTPDTDVPPGSSKCSWWPINKPDKGTRFKTIDAALKYFRSIYWVRPPEGNAEAFIYSGHLQIFEDGPSGLRQIPRLTRQTSLFDNLPPVRIVEKQIDLLPSASTAGFSYGPDEEKIIRAGFILVRYDRDKKTVQRTHDNPRQGWAPAMPFNTYAAAEKTLKEMLKADNIVEVTLDGKANRTTSAQKLYAAGFDFYRTEGIIPGHGFSPRIKSGRKGWGTLEKFETPRECQIAWGVLMKNDKALEG